MAISAQIKGINPWHRDLADWLLLHAQSPGWNKRAAEHFKVTQGWISTVVHSDAFQDYYLRRREEATKPALFSAREKMLGTLDLSIDRLSERIEAGGDQVPLGTLLETIDILAKRTGHGEAKAPGEIHNTVVLVTKEELAESRARMRSGVKPSLVLEASVEEPSQPPTPLGRS